MKSSIEWIVGPVHTGKSTRLANRIGDNPKTYCGVLATVDADGKRYLHNIVTGEKQMLDCPPEAHDAIGVGPYTFSKKVFAWARDVLLQHQTDFPTRTLVIDEIGKLELRNEGLADVCWKIIQLRKKKGFPTILVVREVLAHEVQRLVKAG